MKILFADDHQLILDGLKAVIQNKFKNAEIYTAKSKNELFIQLKTSKNINQPFHILIQDIKFGKNNAMDFIEDIKLQHPNLKILVLSSISDSVSISRICKKVNGYVLKSEPVEEILNALESLYHKNNYISKAATQKLNAYTKDNAIVLSRREKEVLTELMKEKSTKEIADTLYISPKTVEMHRGNLFLKLEVKNVTGLVKKVIALDLLGE
ncbi:MAG TPA: response regulator transcription factor [Crocinitomix sp.]|nr:response regulator transcription factor [Crocinitomix sp.]